MKNQKSNEDACPSLIPTLQRKFLVILLSLGVVAIFLPSYLQGMMLKVAYIPLACIAIATFGLYQNFCWQKIHRRLRPFVVTRILQLVSIIGYISLLSVTIPSAIEKQAWIPYGVFWAISFVPIWQFFSVFRAAHQAKEDHPDRCEFC